MDLQRTTARYNLQSKSFGITFADQTHVRMGFKIIFKIFDIEEICFTSEVRVWIKMFTHADKSYKYIMELLSNGKYLYLCVTIMSAQSYNEY